MQGCYPPLAGTEPYDFNGLEWHHSTLENSRQSMRVMCVLSPVIRQCTTFQKSGSHKRTQSTLTCDSFQAPMRMFLFSPPKTAASCGLAESPILKRLHGHQGETVITNG